MYRCSRCDRFVDDDWEVGIEDPENGCEMMCEKCAEDYLDEDGNVIDEQRLYEIDAKNDHFCEMREKS